MIEKKRKEFKKKTMVLVRSSWKIGRAILLNTVDINIHVGINDTPFSYASVDFPRALLLCLISDEGSSLWGTVTRPPVLFNMSLWLILGAHRRPPTTKSISFSGFTSCDRFSLDLFCLIENFSFILTKINNNMSPGMIIKLKI